MTSVAPIEGIVPGQLERAAEVLAGAPEVAIACHVNPDPDAIGSMLGLSSFLRERGSVTICAAPNERLELPGWSTMLPGADGIVGPADFPKDPEVMVTCDCASFDRLGGIGAAAEKARELIWIDHHRSNDGRGTIRLVDPAASSTCELVFRLVSAIGGPVPTATAVALYAGLVTDTGRFQYEATTPETLRVAAELREHPFDHARLVQALYEDHAPAYLEVVGLALRRLTSVPEADLVWTYLTQDDLVAAGVHPAETDDLIDVVRTDRDADVAVLVKQQKDGRFKVSMRSRGAHDLAAVASTFGGGGHRLAAGFTSDRGPAATIERVVAALGAPAVP